MQHGDRLFHFGRTLFHAFFEGVVRFLQGGIAALNLLEHFIETPDEFTDFVVILAARPQAIVFCRRHRARCTGEAQNGRGDHAL